MVRDVLWIFQCLFVSLIIIAATGNASHGREVPNVSDICDLQPDPTADIQCYCQRNSVNGTIKHAECFLINKTKNNHNRWELFQGLGKVISISFINRHVAFNIIPTKAIAYLNSIVKLDIKYEDIGEIQAYAFANHSRMEELLLSHNQIEKLRKHAFTHHAKLEIIVLDQNKLEEIDREVFEDLPALRKLFLTNNKITTVHDRAFRTLKNLKELDMEKNNIFALSTETFAGLQNLLKLELGSNALEVIGDYTFKSLVNLQYLNLASNRIQVLDKNAFSGLKYLQYLSLSYNQLTSLPYDGLFEGLHSLNTLLLTGNKLKELKKSRIEPVLKNFFEQSAMLNIEDNRFACNCSLEWIIELQNRTKNEFLQKQLDNLKCDPDPVLAKQWKELEDLSNVPDTEVTKEPSTSDYEYYDVSQLGGMLFYTDVSQFLNCNYSYNNWTSTLGQSNNQKIPGILAPTTTASSMAQNSPTKATTPITNITTKKTSNQKQNKNINDKLIKQTTAKQFDLTKPATRKANRGDLDDAKGNIEDSTPGNYVISTTSNGMGNETQLHYTSPLVTVSPEPKTENHEKYQQNEMASDEAVSKLPNLIPNNPKVETDVTISSNGVLLSYCIFLIVPSILLSLT